MDPLDKLVAGGLSIVGLAAAHAAYRFGNVIYSDNPEKAREEFAKAEKYACYASALSIAITSGAILARVIQGKRE